MPQNRIYMRTPKPPSLASRPLHVAEFHGFADPDQTPVYWRLALRRYKTHQKTGKAVTKMLTPVPYGDEWLNMKLYASDKVINKANYWVTWNPDKAIWGLVSDRGILRDHRPHLYAAVTAYLKAEGSRLHDGLGYHRIRRDGESFTIEADELFDALAIGLHPVPMEIHGRAHMLPIMNLLTSERGIRFTRIEDPILGPCIKRV